MRQLFHGQVLICPEKLTEEQFARYRAGYCGLCRCLKERNGQLSRLTLNYDMTFLVLLLGSLYEPEERSGESLCLVHPREKRPWFISEATEYAADMNLALARLKLLDNWQDDGNPLALAEAAFLKKAYEKIGAAYPRQCAAIGRSLSRLHEIEKENREAPDEAAGCFGELMGEVFILREDRWSGILRAMGRALGRFIYIMDACMDLDADTFHNRYNPFRRYYGLRDNERRFRDILKMTLGECLYYFDALPLVQDAGIMKNILCAGLWAQFDRKYSKKGPSDDSGSV